MSQPATAISWTENAPRNGIMRKLDAPAKINLFLHITGRRGDGYHLLSSLVAFAEYGDSLYLSYDQRDILVVRGPFARALGPPHENLLRRCQELWRHHIEAMLPPLRCELTKLLPVGGGLGGGSSDVAALLRSLCHERNYHIADAEIQDLALKLGADVPVCLMPQTQWMMGIGDICRGGPKLTGQVILLVNPGKAVSTKTIFAALRQDLPEFSPAFRQPPPDPQEDIQSWFAWLRNQRNDLEKTVFRLYPDVEKFSRALAELPGCVLSRMSGSGSSFFAFFNNEEQAHSAVSQLHQSYGACWAHVTRLL